MFNEEQAAAYLAGIIDGEGNVSKQNRVVSVGNTDYEVIRAVQECCEVLGLNCSTYGPRQPRGNRKPYWDVHMRGKTTLQRILDVVPIQIERKRAVLSEQLSQFKFSPPPPREWLYQKYIVEDLTGPQIAKLCNTNNPRVYRWLTKRGIDIKPGAAGVRIEPPSREWLVEQYKVQGKSPALIAQELGVGYSTLYRWIHNYRIPVHHPPTTDNE